MDKMDASFNLYILSSNGPEVYAVDIYKDDNKDDKDKNGYVKINNANISLDILKVLHLRDYVCSIKGVGDSDKNNLKLWKLTVNEGRIENENISTEKDIVKNLDGKEMELEDLFKTHFKDELDNKNKSGSSIITIIPATVTSIEDAMTKILEGSHMIMILESDYSEHKPKSMPLKQRNFNQAIDIIYENFNNSMTKHGVIAKTKYCILLCGGAPGIGKTRYGIELFNYLNKKWKVSKGQKNPYMIHMFLDFSNSYVLENNEIQGDMEIASEIILGLRLAYYYFVSKSYVMSFSMFCAKADKYKQFFRLDNVLTHIYNHARKSLQPDQHLFIFLQIDEFQLIFKNRDEGAKLFKQLMYTLGHHMARKIPNIFVQTLLSGTAPQDAIRSMEPTMYSCIPIDLPLLSLESRLDIMRKFATDYNVSDCVWVPQIWIHQLLLDTGGLPRALEYLFIEFFGINFTKVKEFFKKLEKKKLIPARIYNRIVNELDNRYKISTYASDHEMLIYELVYRNIMGIESNTFDKLKDCTSTIKLEHLERDGHLILRKLKAKNKVLIDIPYFFMYLYVDILGIFSNNLDKAFLPDSDWSWENWEIFIADFIVSRITLINKLKKEKSLKLRDFFLGAQGSDVTLDLLINFEPVEIYKLNHQFPCLNLSTKEGKTAMLKPGYMMINGYAAPFADIFLFVDNPEPILMAIQCRLRRKSLDLKTIKDEHKKNTSVSSKMKEKAENLRENAKIASRKKKEELRNEAKQYAQLANLLSKYRIITIFITTQRFSREVECIPEDCILIHQENFDIFFGSVFSSRTKFVMTRDSNPNLSTASELISRYKAIDENIGQRFEQTRNKRLFRSFEDFCQEFPELKDDKEIQNDFTYYPYPPYIEPFEYSNKRVMHLR